jgi:hypothetical protein
MRVEGEGEFNINRDRDPDFAVLSTAHQAV